MAILLSAEIVILGIRLAGSVLVTAGAANFSFTQDEIPARIMTVNMIANFFMYLVCLSSVLVSASAFKF